MTEPKQKNQQKLQSLTYQNCNSEGHQSEPLSRVCIDNECKQKTLICSLCEQQKHKKHETVPLKKFLQKFSQTAVNGNKQKKNNNQNKENISLLYYANKLDQVRKSFFNSVEEFRREVLGSLGELESHARIYFNKAEDKLRAFMEIQNPIEFFTRQPQPQQKLKKYLTQLLSNMSLKQKFSLGEKLDALILKSCQKQKQLQVGLTKLKQDSYSQFTKLQISLDPECLASIEKTVFKWSQEMKGTKMKINGTVVEQTGMQSSGQRFIMLEPCLNDIYDSKCTWGIKVIKFVGWIGVGVCLKNVIQKANYFFNYSTIGHGSYMISNNGYSWSHSSSQNNSMHKTFHYALGDIVYVEYDKVAKKLRFRKNQGPQKFEMDIVDPPPGDYYYPCANICSTGDTIEVINPGVELSS